MRTLLQDLRFGFRLLTKSPGFTTVAVLTLALGIGANTAIYSVVHAAFSPMQIPEPERVTMVWTDNAARNWHQFPASVPDYVDWKESGVFSELGAFRDGGFNLRFADETEHVDGIFVTSEIFGAFQAKPQLGRLFQREDLQPGHDAVVVLTDGLWRSRFASDPGAVGRTLVVDGRPATIIGVLPRNFPKFEQEKVYVPLIFQEPAATDRGTRSFGVLGRLRPGLSLAAAQHRMTELSLRLARQYPDADGGNTAELQRIEEALVQDARTLLIILLGAVAFVLLIACANVANLLLARSTARGKEMAIRAALGASRWDLCRQLLTESVLLAVLGGIVAILPAAWGTDFIASFRLQDLPNADLIAVDPAVLAFNFLIALFTGLLFGLIPAWQVWKADIHVTLKSAARSYTRGGRRRVRTVFVVSELAFTLVLLVGAGLMVQSFVRLRSANPGFNAHGVLTAKVALSDRQYATPEKQAAFFDEALRRVRELPGVVSAGASDELPASDNLHGTSIFFGDRPEPRHEDVQIVLHDSVTSDYFRAMRIPQLRGRGFSESDRKQSPPVAIVDEFTAKRYWPNGDPVGKQIKLGRKQPLREVVGVVGNVDQGILVRVLKGQIGQVYVPIAQDPKPAMSLVVRSLGDPTALVPAVRQTVRDLNMDQPIFQVQTLEAARAAGRASQRLATILLAGFAVVALLLAVIGLYGVVSYGVGQRTREFGIRLALGAPRREVLHLVLRQGAMLAVAGAGLGLAGAFALTRLMSTLLYGVQATDPLTFAGVTFLLIVVALVASYLPARRATRTDSLLALREE